MHASSLDRFPGASAALPQSAHDHSRVSDWVTWWFEKQASIQAPNHDTSDASKNRIEPPTPGARGPDSMRSHWSVTTTRNQ